MNTAGAVILALVLLLIAAAAGWVIFTRVRASRLGLPPPPWKSYIPFLSSSSASYGSGGPAPAPGGIIGWVNDRIRLLRHRNKRTAAGAYEGSSSYNAGYASTAGGNHNGAPGFRGFEEDDPWDSRVGGYNPYEEERELGLVTPAHGTGHGHGPYGGHGQGQGRGVEGEGYQMNLPVAPATGGGYEEERGRTRSRSPGPSGALSARPNPFGDDVEPSNISLRGVSPRPMAERDTSFAGRKARGEDDRKSMFREEM